MDMQTEHIHDLAEGYALGALELGERNAVEQHLAVCPPCAQQIRSLEETVHFLAFTAAAVAPPVRCKRNVLEKIEREEFLARPTRRSRANTALGVWASFATVALVLMSMYSFSARRDLKRALADTAAAEATVAEMQTQLAEYEGLDLAIADGQVMRTLNGQGSSEAAKASFLMQPGKNEAYLVMKGLEPLPAGKVYQVWVAREGVQQPLTIFVPDPARKAMFVKIVPPEPMDRYKEIMVTIEDDPNDQRPSPQTVLAGNI